VSAQTTHFSFVQFDVPGRLGLDDGRYLLRGEGDEADTVVVVQTLGVAASERSSRRRRSRRASSPDQPLEVPLTRLIVIPAQASDAQGAEAEFHRVAGESEAAEAAVTAALSAANRMLHAHRVATGDPYGHEVAREAAIVTRVGYGTGAGLAEGRWEDAVEVPQPARRRRRAEALRPQERLAAVLGGRQPIDACETLLLRARADLDQGRSREAALQLRVGLEALLAELPGRAGPDQEDDLAALEQRRARTEQAGHEAARCELSRARAEEVAETLAICERVLRRRQILAE
jgi:hypothetical protein